jgi:hypothetical protein
MKIKLAMWRTQYGSTIALEAHEDCDRPDKTQISEVVEVDFPDLPDIEVRIRAKKMAWIADQIEKLQREMGTV